MSLSRIEQLRMYLKEEPDDVFLNYTMALELKSSGELDKSLEYLNKTLSLQSQNIPALYQKGEVLSKLNRIEEAISVLKEGIQCCILQENTKSKNEFEQALFLLED
ncbi:MAG: tetratricopeptide repeat protein [Bacteroidia bacterium]